MRPMMWVGVGLAGATPCRREHGSIPCEKEMRNAKCYASRYPDLARAYCGGGRDLVHCDIQGLLHHFREFGKEEGRRFRCKDASDAKRVRVFYGFFADDWQDALTEALTVASQQMITLSQSPLFPLIVDVMYATVGAGPNRHPNVAWAFASSGATHLHLGHSPEGDASAVFGPMHEFCARHPESAVAYLTNVEADEHVRSASLRGLSSQPCAAAIGGANATSCDVCSFRFSPVPFEHTPGNMWLAECAYVAKLKPPNVYKRSVEEVWRASDCGLKCGAGPRDADLVGREADAGPHDDDDCGRACGAGRYALDHWIHSHPSVRPCDVLDDAYHYSKPGGPKAPTYDFPIAFALAPRYDLGHAWWPHVGPKDGPAAADNAVGLWPRDDVAAVKREWIHVYGEGPPADSRLLRHYEAGGRHKGLAAVLAAALKTNASSRAPTPRALAAALRIHDHLPLDARAEDRAKVLQFISGAPYASVSDAARVIVAALDVITPLTRWTGRTAVDRLRVRAQWELLRDLAGVEPTLDDALARGDDKARKKPVKARLRASHRAEV